MKAIREKGMKYIQLRPQWRWHERSEGEYQWDDIDKLLEFAEEENLKVIFKFMLETAPQYIYDKYDGYRYGLDGRKLWPIGHAAFYPGGWQPCFDNPKVMERAKLFVQQAIERYKDCPQIAVWHVWNEPRSCGEECTCAHSQKSYYDYLKENYKTIERLNAFSGKCWADFKDVGTPHSTSDFIEMFLWRKCAANRVAWRVGKIYETIKRMDATRPVIAHVGMPSVTQDAMRDTSDDWLTRQGVDFYGTSFEVRYDHPALIQSTPFLLVDWQRSVSGNGYFWVNELYPSRGRWEPENSPEVIDSWFWTCIAAGAKGLLFWQYKKERIGFETNDAGMVEINGEENPTSLKLTKSMKKLNDISAELADTEVPKSEIALIYDFDSDLLSAVEDSNFPEIEKALGMNSYKAAFRGMYHLLWRLGVRVEILSSHELERINEFEVVYAPYMQMIDQSRADVFKSFVDGGGKLVADSGFALRDANTWLHPTRPGAGTSEIFGCVEKERVRDADAEWRLSSLAGDFACNAYLIRASFAMNEGTEFMRYANGEAAVICNSFGEGEAWLLGISPGISYVMSAGEERSDELLIPLLNKLSLKREDQNPAENGMCRRTLHGAEGDFEFMFKIKNNSECLIDSVDVKVKCQKRITNR